VIAALRKLTRGTRVRLKVGFNTPLGNTYPAGMTGTIRENYPIRFNDGALCVWIWYDGKRGKYGGWTPIGNLVRLKGK
jgi:hypothetical protein